MYQRVFNEKLTLKDAKAGENLFRSLSLVGANSLSM